jgi:hypothetical protein
MARKYKEEIKKGKLYRKTTWLEGSVILKLAEISDKEMRSQSDTLHILATNAINKYKL